MEWGVGMEQQRIGMGARERDIEVREWNCKKWSYVLVQSHSSVLDSTPTPNTRTYQTDWLAKRNIQHTQYVSAMWYHVQNPFRTSVMVAGGWWLFLPYIRCLSSLSWLWKFRTEKHKHSNHKVILSEWMNRVHLVITKARAQFAWIIKWLRDFLIFYRLACVSVCRCIQLFFVRIVVVSMTKCYLNEINTLEWNRKFALTWADRRYVQCRDVYSSVRFYRIWIECINAIIVENSIEVDQSFAKTWFEAEIWEEN